MHKLLVGRDPVSGTSLASQPRHGLADYEPVVVYRAGVSTGRPDQDRAL